MISLMPALNCVTKETFCAWGDKAIEREKKRERERVPQRGRERQLRTRLYVDG